ncbi:MAG: substrate-binding domain-containing protein [Nitrospiraceae bacterium]
MNPTRLLALSFMLTLFIVMGQPVGAEVSGSLTIAGNGPESTTMELLARAFEKANPRVYIDVLWEDNSKPIEMVKSGQAHLAVTGGEDPDLLATHIGWDGIAIMVNLSNFTKEVTKQQVADIFSGKVKMWSELGGPDTKILLIDRPRNQNIRDAFETHLGITGKIADSAKVIGRDEKVIKTVVGTLPPLSAVAYLSLNQALSSVTTGVAVRILPVDKVEPEMPTVKDGRYTLRRPVLLLSKKEANSLIDAFRQFTLSDEGQKIVSEIYTPIGKK